MLHENRQMIEIMIQSAREMLPHAYAPYSRFHVAATLLAASGHMYRGCNIENAAFGPSVCAERTAFFQAICQGERDFQGIVILGGPDGIIQRPTPPCGVCRQVMIEFCDPKTFEIILPTVDGSYKIYTLEELQPLYFSHENIL